MAYPSIGVFGIGSPFGLDRAGWWAVDALQARRQFFDGGTSPAPVLWQILDRPGSGLLSWLEGLDTAILIDAVHGSGPCGRVHCWGVEALLTTEGALSSHAWGVADSLRLGRALGMLPRRLRVIGIDVGPDAPCEGPREGGVDMESLPAETIRQLVSILLEVLGKKPEDAGIFPSGAWYGQG